MKDKIRIQKEFFNKNNTLSYNARLNALKDLKRMILDNQGAIENALYLDLNKSITESYMTEIGIVLSEINYYIKKLKSWIKPKKVKTSLANFPAKSYIYKEPYGVTLVISPWNYPFLLAIQPMISAIAAGNTVILKPSEIAVNTERLLAEIIPLYFNEGLITVVCGDKEVTSQLLEFDFDFIFFTGSSKVGKIVAEKAAKKLIPVVLELGGKSPVIVDETANVDLAVKRILFGKLLNAGQTCVAPDYLLIHESIRDIFITKWEEQASIMIGDYKNNCDYPKIVSVNHLKRLKGLLEDERIIYGGNSYEQKLEMTLVDANLDSPLMQEEIFGPILPIISFNKLDVAIDIIKNKEKPLACYYFSTNKKRINMFLDSISFGGGCINDTVIHLCSNELPFGGVGASGIGNYHGKAGFNAFSHEKSIIKKGNLIDLPFRYQPYSIKKRKLIKKFLK